MKHEAYIVTCTNNEEGEHRKFRRSSRGINKNRKCCPACGDPLLTNKGRLTKKHTRQAFRGQQSRTKFFGLSQVYVWR